MMKCTGCGNRTQILHSNWWTCRDGYIIREDENLCDDCVLKRTEHLPIHTLELAEEKLAKEIENER